MTSDESLTTETAMAARWYAKPDDLIGGWCVMDIDETPRLSGRPWVATFCSEQVARHIADLHNRWRFGRQMLGLVPIAPRPPEQ
jgi:hypothetical protein